MNPSQNTEINPSKTPETTSSPNENPTSAALIMNGPSSEFVEKNERESLANSLGGPFPWIAKTPVIGSLIKSLYQRNLGQSEQ